MEKSRIVFRPVIAGTLLTIALMLFLSSSVQNLFASSEGGTAFRETQVWFTMTLVWIASVFAGSVTTSLAARCRATTDGILNGLTVWAASYLALGVLISARAGGYEPIAELADVSRAWVLKDFGGELSALLAGVAGGVLGSRGVKARPAPLAESPSSQPLVSK